MLERIGIVLSLTVNHARSVIATQITFSECLTWHGTTVLRNPLDNFQPSVIYMRCNWFDTQPAAARNFPDRVIKKERKRERKPVVWS